MTVPSREEIAKRLPKMTTTYVAEDGFPSSRMLSPEEYLDALTHEGFLVVMGYDHDGTPVFWGAP